jgi:Protein of unknown function (DUF3237)
MRLEPFYRVTFTAGENWYVEVAGPMGAEGQGFLIAEGRCEGGLSGRYRGANSYRQRADGIVLPDFRGVIETDDGATIVFAWRGLTRPKADGGFEIVGSITHLSGQERYRWLNARECALAGQGVPSAEGPGYDVMLEVAELIWEPIE